MRKLPWESFTPEEIRANCKLLKAGKIKLVGLTAHDSSDGSLEIFRQEFRRQYVNIKVGETILLDNR